MTTRRIAIIVVVLAVIGLIAYRFATSGKTEAAPSFDEVRRTEGIPVDIYAAASNPFDRWREVTGSLEGIQQAPLYANIPARVRNLLVRQGQHVGVGTAVIALDPLSVNQSYSAQETARLQYENAKRDFDRLQPLHAAGAISDSQFDQARLAVEAAEAAMRDINATLTLRSPISGVITDLRVRAGDKINPGDTLAVIAQIQQARLKVEVSQRDVAEIAVGQPAQVVTDAGAGEGITGTVATVGLSADAASRLFLVEVTLDSEGALRPGTLQAVRIRTTHLDEAVQVPGFSLIQSGDKMFVYVVGKDNVVEKRPVQIGPHNDRFVVVTEGVQPGDQIVVWGQNLLAGGEKVQIHKVVKDI